MKRLLTIVLCCLMAFAALAGGEKRVSHNYKDISIAKALKQLEKEAKGRYVINFMYDELEDFRITTRVKKQIVPDAIRQMIGHYPISMTIEGDSAIYVECIPKVPARFKGIVVDEDGEPLEFANVSLLASDDSTELCHGVTTASGRFVIPYEPQTVIMQVTYVGYKPAYRHCETDEAGTIKMEPEEFVLDDVTVTGSKEKKPKKADKHESQHVILTMNDGTVIDGYLKGDIMGKTIRVSEGDYRGAEKKYKVEDIQSLVFTSINDSSSMVYEPVMVVDEFDDDQSQKTRLLSKVYESDYIVGYYSPVQDYYETTVWHYRGPTSTKMGAGTGTWSPSTARHRRTTGQYYFQIKGNSVAIPYWRTIWSGSRSNVKHFIKHVFGHFPGIIEEVNSKEFNYKEFSQHPDVLMPVLDQAVQNGDYQAAIVTEEKKSGWQKIRPNLIRLGELAAFLGILLLL